MAVEDAFPSSFSSISLPSSYLIGLLEKHLCRPSPGVFSRIGEIALVVTLGTLAGLVSWLAEMRKNLQKQL